MIKNSQETKDQEQSYKTNFAVKKCKNCGKEDDFKVYAFDRNGNYRGKEIIPEEVVFKAKLFVHLEKAIFKENIHHKSVRSLITKVEKKDDDWKNNKIE